MRSLDARLKNEKGWLKTGVIPTPQSARWAVARVFALEKPTRPPPWLWLLATCLQIAYRLRTDWVHVPQRENPAIYSIAGFQYLLGVADGARTTRQKGIENQGLTERSGDLCRQIRDTDS